MAIAHVAIETNPRTRKSRLFDSTFSYIKKSAATIVRIYAMYEPLKVFTYVGLIIFAAGCFLALRFVYYFFTTSVFGPRMLQSLIFSAVLLIVGAQVLAIGLLADVISGNRKLLEDVLYRVRSLEAQEPAAATREEPRRADPAAAGQGRWER
jgi:hypothetical protein